MKLLGIAYLSAALVAGASFPVQADSLLGILGSKDSGALVTLGSGDAGTSGLVNLGLGGDDQVLDANVGDGGLASARVGSGGDSALDADVRLLNNNARVGVGIGGGGLLDVDIGIGGGDGGNPVPGNPGNPGSPGNPGTPGGGGILASTGGAGGNVCAGLSVRELDRLSDREGDLYNAGRLAGARQGRKQRPPL